ncbi:MAG: glycosyltransferase family 4 protein [Patescibacteria group bacterium]
MKILMVSSYLPYPLYSGGHIRLYNILKRLSKNHEITLVCEKRPYQTEDDVRGVEKICQRLITIPRKKQWSYSNILRTGFSTMPFLLIGHYLPKMRDEIEALLKKEKFDLIHVETFYVVQNIPNTQIPIIVAEHNIEYDVYKRYADKTPFFLKPLINIDVLKLKIQEEEVWKNTNAVVAVSKQDKEIIEKFNKNVYLIPNGVDLNKFKFKSDKSRTANNGKTILYIGDFKWIQNRDAVEMILRKIWPKLESNLKLWIVGKNIPQKLKEIGGKNVIFDENASDDTSDIFKNSYILLAPLRVGGGTSYKILEAMASGVPVITTALGSEGLAAENKKELIVADTEVETIIAVKDLIQDKDLYDKIRLNARKLIEEKYNWDVIVGDLEKVYRKTIAT